MHVLVVGDANADLSAPLLRFPLEGDDVPLTSLSWGSGGAGTNVATALARLGGAARLLTRVGRDPAAEVALAAARAAGVDLEAVQRDPAQATGLCLAAVSPGGERTFFSFRGANAALTRPRSDLLRDTRWLHVCGHALLSGAQRETTLELVDEASRRGVAISLDLCLPLLRADRDVALELAPRLRVVFTSEAELAALGQPREAALAALEERGAALIAAKLGERGSLLAGAVRRVVPGFPAQARDTTGCGDAYAAAFILASLRGAPPAVAARLGNAVGALVATRLGAADALPTVAELHAFLVDHDATAELDALAPTDPREDR